jgi:hypothetical protein
VTTSQNAEWKRYGLLALAILLVLSGGVCMYLGTHNFQIRSLGLAAIAASGYFVRLSRVRDQSKPLPTNYSDTTVKARKGPGRRLWIVSAALVPFPLAALYLIQRDIANGGHEAWPADLFGGIIIVCAIVWSCLAAKIVASR